jgi:serine/threonine protein kinase
MGQVYLVEHRELGRECVAKLVHEKLASEPQLLERVRIEAEALNRSRLTWKVASEATDLTVN